MISVSRMASKALRVPQLGTSGFDRAVEEILCQKIDSVIAELPLQIGRLFDRLRVEFYLAAKIVLWSFRLSKGTSRHQFFICPGSFVFFFKLVLLLLPFI